MNTKFYNNSRYTECIEELSKELETYQKAENELMSICYQKAQSNSEEEACSINEKYEALIDLTLGCADELAVKVKNLLNLIHNTSDLGE